MIKVGRKRGEPKDELNNIATFGKTTHHHTLIILPLAIVSLLVSCEIVQQEYSYVETVSEPSLFGGSYSSKEKEPAIIKEKNDTLAYLAAYQKFVISQKVFRDMSETYGAKHLSVPKSFALFNSKGENLAYIEFPSKVASEIEIYERVFSIDNSLERIKQESEAEKKAQLKVDSAAVASLLPFFNVKKDEFDPRAPVWYVPKNAPKYVNRNGIYCYFETENDIPQNFRIKIQYYAEDWLFIRKVQFSIDGNPYEFIPTSPERDHDNGYIREWIDEQVSLGDVEIIKALANAKTAKMKLIGSKYHNIKTITPQQILDIKRAVDLYEAKGGQLK